MYDITQIDVVRLYVRIRFLRLVYVLKIYVFQNFSPLFEILHRKTEKSNMCRKINNMCVYI
ncbi:MAG: hypothetical protein DBX61_09325 [Clostridiales bacterium]|nr:MAG: hypothetical protein DBX61_09325 [Clostridiales bacterium]